MMETKPKRPISIYLSYAQKDEPLKQEFEDYLAIMQQNGFISGWVERQVQQGTNWSQVIDPRLLLADLVLVLVSPSLFASGYFSGAEIRAALERRSKREAHIIPIILYRVNLKGYPFEAIMSAPRNGPISSWSDRNAAWSNVEQEICASIKDMTKQY